MTTDLPRPYLKLQDAKAEDGEGGITTYDITWRLAVDPDGLTAEQLLPETIVQQFTGQLPRRGIAYPNNSLATCRKVSCVFVQRGFYDFHAHYSTSNSSSTDPGTSEDPLQDRPKLDWLAWTESRAIDRDRDDNANLNTAGDPIKQSVRFTTFGAKITKNVTSLPSYILSYANTTNAAAFTIGGLSIPVNAALFVLQSGFLSKSQLDRNGIPYYEFSYELHFDDRDKWYGRPLNAGFRELVFDDTFTEVPAAITNRDGSEISDPAPLDTDGYKIEVPTTANVIFRTFKNYIESDFTQLPGISEVP